MRRNNNQEFRKYITFSIRGSTVFYLLSSDYQHLHSKESMILHEKLWDAA